MRNTSQARRLKNPTSSPLMASGPSSAFTLIELTIVMLILSIITALAAPHLLDAVSYHRVEAAAERIRHDLLYAQHMARTKSTQQAVVFDTVTSSYSLTGLADFDRPSSTYAVHLSDAPMSAILDSADFNGAATVVFNGFGLPTASGSVVVHVGRQQRVIKVESDGYISIE